MLGVSEGLTIAGAVFQLAGLTLVFAELAAIRAYEFGKPEPWRRIAQWTRSKLGHPHVISVGAALGTSSAMSVRSKKRPGALPTDATDADRIARLERYVACLDEDSDDLWQTIQRERGRAVAESEQHNQELREEIKLRDQQRRAQLRSSVTRQTIGAVCVLIGLALTIVEAAV
jgi:hypothetical protein